MSLTWQPGNPLGTAVDAGAMFAAWCAGAGEGLDATAELDHALAAAAPATAARWFTAPGCADWARDHADDQPSDQERTRQAADLKALAAGGAQVVVTGQQPGYLGGPLYTLHKIATTVALARQLTAAGRPTVPVFWSGDDDDDLREALAPVAWSPPDTLVRSEALEASRRRRGERSLVGRLQLDQGQASGLAWLAARVATADDPHGPAALWLLAAGEGWSWARLQRCALLRMFAGQGLLVVSGDDSRLHRAAEPFYRSLTGLLPELAELVRRRGEELVGSGWQAQLDARAGARPLYIVAGDGRRPLQGDLPGDCGSLRPGVMLRSPLQDWLLAPGAVVIGPGEHAYLRQLTTLYARLGVPRAPLVPRLFAWLLPNGFDRRLLARHRAPVSPRTEDLRQGLEHWQQESAAALRQLLGGPAALPPARVEAITDGRLRRWRRGLEAALRAAARDEARRLHPHTPAWVFPDGQRQERKLAWAAARTLWGPPLVPALLAAAAAHLEHGRRHDWREWEITVPGPKEQA